HLNQRLRRETTVSNQGAVHIEHRVKQILVMTGENLQIGTLTTDNRDLRIPPAHIAHAVLHGEDTWQRRDFELGLEIVSCFRRVWILKEDQRQTAFLVDRAIAVLWRTLLAAK